MVSAAPRRMNTRPPPSPARKPRLNTAPIFAIRKLLDKIGKAASDVDLWEINEAFAVVTMAAIRELALHPARVNVNGGACALGHPIGDSDGAVAAIESVRASYGPARILVCCAGIAPAGRIIGRNGPMALAAFRRVIDVNLLGSFNLLRLAAADMAGAISN